MIRFAKAEDMFSRKVCRDDLQFLAEFRNNDWASFHRRRLVVMEDQEHWYESALSDPFQAHFMALKNLPDTNFQSACDHGFKLRGGLASVGVFSLSGIDMVSRKASVSWAVAAELRGRGYGKAIVAECVHMAFSFFNLRRVECEILVSNIASVKAAEAAGMTREGIKVSAVWNGEHYEDSLLYGIVRRDKA